MVTRTACGLLCLALVACGKPEPPPVVVPLPAEPEPLVTSANRFALDAYRRLEKGQDNCVISPISLWMTLAMVYTGARGETAAQLAKAMHLTQAPDELPAAVAGLDPLLREAATKVDLRLACAVWFERGLPVKPDYERQIRAHFGARVQRYRGGDLAALSPSIDRWARRATKGRITHVAADVRPDRATTVVLANAAYLVAKWADDFDAKQTREEPFYTLAGPVEQVPMMHQAGDLAYVRAVDADVVELPYRGGKLAMTIVAPDKGKFAAWEKKLDEATLTRLIGKLESVHVRLAMPRWETRTTRQDLIGELKLPLRDRYDLTGITDQALAPPLLYQQSWIQVDEQGTKALSFSLFAARKAEMNANEVTVTLNRPFLYFIRERASGLILFCGRVTRPTDTSDLGR